MACVGACTCDRTPLTARPVKHSIQLQGQLNCLLKYELNKLQKTVYKEMHKKVLKTFCQFTNIFVNIAIVYKHCIMYSVCNVYTQLLSHGANCNMGNIFINIFITKRLWHRYFPANFSKLRTPFFTEDLRWLFLEIIAKHEKFGKHLPILHSATCDI